ncbi:MAG: hypothetical protein ACYCW6_17800 [Candidatus Xenobia bacterium]
MARKRQSGPARWRWCGEPEPHTQLHCILALRQRLGELELENSDLKAELALLRRQHGG